MAPPNVARTGVWVGIGAVIMSFAAYTSAMVVRQGSTPEWHHITLPPILYWNSLVLVALRPENVRPSTPSNDGNA